MTVRFAIAATVLALSLVMSGCSGRAYEGISRTPDEVAVVKRGGYLIWFEVNFRDNYTHMMASGESEWTQLVFGTTGIHDPSRSDYVQKKIESQRQILRTIEDFVKQHRPSTALYLPMPATGEAIREIPA